MLQSFHLSESVKKEILPFSFSNTTHEIGLRYRFGGTMGLG